MCVAVLWVSKALARSYKKPQLCQDHYQIPAIEYKWDWRGRSHSSGMDDKRGWLGREEFVTPACCQLDFLAAKDLPLERKSPGVPSYFLGRTA